MKENEFDEIDNEIMGSSEPVLYDESSKDCWVFHAGRKEWIQLPPPMLRTSLKMRGFAAGRPKYEDGELVNELDSELARIHMHCRVAGVNNLAGYKLGVHDMNGGKILVPKSPKLVEPKAGSWDTIEKLLRGLFVAEGFDQLDYVLSWWHHALHCLYFGPHAPGPALALAGPVKCGKTLMTELFRLSLGHKVGQPWAWMTGRDNFNKELFESVLLVIDDVASSTNINHRFKFAAAIKEMVAASGARCRGMHETAIALKPLWRLVLCLNDNEEKVAVLPPLDDDVEDKIIILKAYRQEMPMPSDTPDEREAFMNQLKAELPCLVHYLLHEYEIPEGMTGRFGVKHWHHPDLVRALKELGPENQLAEMIEHYLRYRGINQWVGTTSELRSDLLRAACFCDSEKKDIGPSRFMGHKLNKLHKQAKYYYQSRHTAAGTEWTIRRLNRS